MKTYSRTETIARMNALAGANVPFLFIVDYAQEQSHIEPLDRIDPATCLFQFPKAGNTETAATALARSTAARCAGPIQWDITPPSPAAYRHSFDLVKQNLLAGNSYLTNLTCRVPVTTNLTLEEIFLHSEALYKLWLKDRFVCFSPEIFVRIEKGKIKSFPMKGTIDATLPDAEQLLMQDTKEAAEHATIVDLIRNDLSMVSEHVEVTSYRYIDRLQTNKGPILQTSSEICGTLPEDYTAHLGDIIFRLRHRFLVTRLVNNEQYLVFLNQLVILDVYLRNQPGDVGGNRHNVGAKARITRPRRGGVINPGAENRHEGQNDQYHGNGSTEDISC